jgi:hypothetical protein
MWKTTSPILSRLAIWFFLHEVNQIIKGLDVKLLAKDSGSNIIWDRYLAARSPQVNPFIIGQVLGLEAVKADHTVVLDEPDSMLDGNLGPEFFGRSFIPLSGVAEACRVATDMRFVC